MRIEESSFVNCSFKSICIPRNVTFIDGSAFIGCACETITFDSENHPFSFDRGFLVDQHEMHFVRYFGRSNEVHIWKAIEIIGDSCFCELEEITIETGAVLMDAQISTASKSWIRGSGISSEMHRYIPEYQTTDERSVAESFRWHSFRYLSR
jgi:hypothetical protein